MGRKSREKRERRESKLRGEESELVLKHPTLEDVYKVASAKTGRYISITLPGWSMKKILKKGPKLAARLEAENWDMLEHARLLNMELDRVDGLSHTESWLNHQGHYTYEG